MNSELGSAPQGDVYDEQWKALSGWFLGPRAENKDVFIDVFKELFEKHVEMRNDYFPSDPAYITQEMKSSHACQAEFADMRNQLMKMQEDMKESVPFFSPRYQAHMCWDTTMPSQLGFMAAMLFNQNNVDSAASPVTTLFEQRVGQQLCDMLGYNIHYEEKEPVGWGHVTCGGSIANIEAVWASRNLKYVPLAIRAALLNEEDKIGAKHFLSKEQIQHGLSTPVLVYSKESGQRESVPIKDCSSWQLLNVDVDEICDLAETVMNQMSRIPPGTVDETKFNELVEHEGLMSLGVFNFMKKHSLEHSPVYTAPANNHYSWPKAGTLLGLGSNALIPINLDKNFRQNVVHLKEVLEKQLLDEVPVIAVAAVMGSTEESAVDPIKAIYDLREEFKEKGLNFALLADGAWGGYFKTMLIGTPGSDRRRKNHKEDKRKLDGFVPYCELSPYVEEQYQHIQFADTITIDPHKSGFCPYPGGALCYRNGKMRYPIALFHPEVFHGEDDPTMGVYGIEGSKPGAAPAGILMSHNVIGLSNRGYGRILGQCTATAKLFYAMWLTVAKEDDPFVCIPLQGLPEGYDMESAKKLIDEHIADKSMREVYQCKKAKQFLKCCGPDTMINTFVVNFRDNTSVKKSNKLQVALADAMNVFVGSDASRVPLMIMQSGLDAKKHGEGLLLFKEKAGLDKNDEDLNVMVNSCMNPWQWNESIFKIGDLFRAIVLNCMGRVEDAPLTHKFVLSHPNIGEDESFFLEYMTCSDVPEHRYQVSVKVMTDSVADRKVLKDCINSCERKDLPVVFESVTPSYDDDDDNIPNLYNILHLKDWDCKIRMKLGNHTDGNFISVKVLDIPRYQRLDISSTVSYPEKQKYFIYGDSTRTIMSHVISKLPDFQHAAILSVRPHSLTECMQNLGVMAEIEDVEGYPLEAEKEMKNPLQRNCYDITFKGELNATLKTSINIKETIFFHKISPN